MKRLFVVKWKIPYANYETYVFGQDEAEAVQGFTVTVEKEVAAYDIESVNELPLDGVIVTRHIQ